MSLSARCSGHTLRKTWMLSSFEVLRNAFQQNVAWNSSTQINTYVWVFVLDLEPLCKYIYTYTHILVPDWGTIWVFYTRD